MCYFVHIAVPGEHAELVRAWPREDLLATDCSVPTLLPQFSRHWAVFTVTDPSGHCSCDLHHNTPKRFDEDRERAKYRAKGWSDAKIARAMAGRRPKQTRHDRFVDRVAQVVRVCGQMELCTVDGHGAEVPAFPRETLRLEMYLAANGAYPHSRIVTVVSDEPAV